MANPRLRIKGERVLGLAVLLLAVIFIWRHSFFITSLEAFINADVHNVCSPISGELRISDIVPGMTFNQGETLFELYNQRIGGLQIFTDYHDLKQRIDQIETDIRQDKVSVEKLEADLFRNEALIKIGGAARETVRGISYKIDLLKIGLLGKERRLKKLRESNEEIYAQLKLHENAVVHMPVEGVVWASFKKNGDFVITGDTVLQIIATNRIWVDAFFQESNAEYLSPGTAVSVTASDTKRQWEGKILFVRKGGFSGNDINNLNDVSRPKKKDERHLVSARIEVRWDIRPSPSDFYGYGKSVVVLIRKYPAIFRLLKRMGIEYNG